MSRIFRGLSRGIVNEKFRAPSIYISFWTKKYEENMKKYLGNMQKYDAEICGKVAEICGKYVRNMKKCVENMKECPLLHGLWAIPRSPSLDRSWTWKIFGPSFSSSFECSLLAKHRAKRGWALPLLRIQSVGGGHSFNCLFYIGSKTWKNSKLSPSI